MDNNQLLTERQATLELLSLSKKMSDCAAELQEIINIEDDNERFLKLMEVVDKIKNLSSPK